MGCDRANELMLDYASGEMHEEARRTFEAHLGSCPECRRELEQMSALLSRMEAEPQLEPTADEIHSCVAVADRALKPIAPTRGVRRWAARAADYAFAGACAAVFALAATIMSLFKVSFAFTNVLDFAFEHQLAAWVGCGAAALVTCFVPIVMHAQRRTGAYWKGG
jgi:anti-sigma factor RsiW